MLVPLVVAEASAQVEACAGPLAFADWDEAMDQVDLALVALDGARSERILDDLVHELRCLDAAATPDRVGRMARQISLVAFFAQDPDELTYWALLARETAGGAPWPDDVPVPVRYLDLVAALPEPEHGRADGGLVVPKGGGALLDGRILLEPAASVGVQHLLQVADRKGVVTFTAWQTGPAFPEDLLGDPVELEVPRWYVEPADPVPVPVPVPVPAPASAPELSFEGDGSSPECPWDGIPADVEARGREVTVAGTAYAVRSDAEQVAFRKLLRLCGEFRAARRFTRWRAARGNPFARAGHWRELMVEALRTPEPKRKRKPKAQ